MFKDTHLSWGGGRGGGGGGVHEVIIACLYGGTNNAVAVWGIVYKFNASLGVRVNSGQCLGITGKF